MVNVSKNREIDVTFSSLLVILFAIVNDVLFSEKFCSYSFLPVDISRKNEIILS